MPSHAERAYIAATIHTAVTTSFAHAEALPAGYDFETEFRRFLDDGMAARTRIAFDKAAMRLMSSLRNGHTKFIDLALQDEPALPFRALRIDGHWIVTATRTSDRDARLDPGDEITTMDGASFDAWATANEVYVRGSDQRETERSLFKRPLLWPEKLGLGLADGRTVPIDRMAPTAAPWRGDVPPKATTTSVPRAGLLLVTIPSFGDPSFEQAAIDAVTRHRDAQAILIDVRGNDGGSTPGHLLSALIGTPYRDMVSLTPLHVGLFDAHARFGDDPLPGALVRFGGEVIEPDHPIYGGKLLLLTDGGCISSCEDFALALRVSKRATIVGETTEGSTGQPDVLDFPSLRMEAWVSTRREVYPDLSPFEGQGVVPDVMVPRTASSIGRTDPVLQKAIALVH